MKESSPVDTGLMKSLIETRVQDGSPSVGVFDPVRSDVAIYTNYGTVKQRGYAVDRSFNRAC